MVHHEHPHEEGPYTMRQALKEAAALLEDEFGKADQDATVALATFLYHAHERDEFLRRHKEEGPGGDFYSPPTTL
jgi:hypothetical protein